ncbi:hypothetical protein L6164_017328 [Bauhinia variegata]|uniref:Uncharacterized protein n=1 Tax=Bauhinia variegata TaxID=167791 RepID=A0ACB9N8Q9_BAUVA|nr:hypothetical protein L6164_017328 [Bauhinia variegata]
MGGKWREFIEELKKMSCIAAPMVAVTVMQYLLQVISVIMVGQIGDVLLLSGVSIATSFTSVTGFSILFGMAGSLETLCGQAYGAKQFQQLGQDPSISRVAYKYSLYLIPNLFSYAILQSLVRYFQTQSLILPMLYSSCATLCFHIPLCWAFVFRLRFGYIGAALAISLSYWLNVSLLVCYMKYSSACKETRGVFSRDVLLSLKIFFRFVIPSAVMTCLEWWSYEVLILLCGLLPNPELETSVLSICFTITYLHYFIPYAFGATASTRVSNELGAGNPESAKMAIWIILCIAAAEIITVSTILLRCRNFVGYAFSSEKQIADHVADMAPLICLSVIVDSLQAVLSG